MATPNYKGQGQPATSSGWLSALFGAQTPAYKSASAQPTPTATATSPTASSSTSGSASPNAIAPVANQSGCEADIPPFAIVIPREVIER